MINDVETNLDGEGLDKREIIFEKNSKEEFRIKVNVDRYDEILRQLRNLD